MNPIVVEVFRGNVVESFHRGVICVVNEAGEVIYSLGDINQVTFPRSAMKYFQHLPLLVSGAFDQLNLSLEDLAIMCGSHNGEKMHEDLVSKILGGLQLGESDLQCGAQAPTLKKDLYLMIKNDKDPSQLHNNCSGKHAGFLAWCKAHHADIKSYLSPNHPLQIEIKKYISMFYEVPENELILAVDGCSAPIYGMSVYKQAIAYKNLIANHFGDDKITESCKKIVSAVKKYPELVAGTHRYCTDLMKITNGRIIGKTGADGVYCLSIPEKKWGISIKIDDGKMGPQYQVAQELLLNLELITTEEYKLLDAYGESEIKNFAGIKVGRSVVVNVPPMHQ
jgi:L-asparaginase II